MLRCALSGESIVVVDELGPLAAAGGVLLKVMQCELWSVTGDLGAIFGTASWNAIE
jgi:hypothetical protein